MTKALLALAIIGIIGGVFCVSGAVTSENSAMYVVLPAGAIFLGLFLISLMLGKESALFDQEQKQGFAEAAGRKPALKTQPSPSANAREGNPVPAH